MPHGLDLSAKRVPVTICSPGGAVDVEAATWPLTVGNFSLGITLMAKNVTCGAARFCFRDWLEWHRNLGVDQFFLYENELDAAAAPWRAVARDYAANGLLTLIRWPAVLGGEDNHLAQRVALNHAAFVFGPRTGWLALFDVDEFLVPAPLGLAPGARPREALAAALRDVDGPPGTYSLIVESRDAQHPATCAPNATRLRGCRAYRAQSGSLGPSFALSFERMAPAFQRRKDHRRRNFHVAAAASPRLGNIHVAAAASPRLGNIHVASAASPRLASFLSWNEVDARRYRAPDRRGHPKMLRRGGPGFPIFSPHGGRPPSPHGALRGAHLVHFMAKHGCRGVDEPGCVRYDSLADSAAVAELEASLAAAPR